VAELALTRIVNQTDGGVVRLETRSLKFNNLLDSSDPVCCLYGPDPIYQPTLISK